MSDTLRAATDLTFGELVLGAGEPVLVEFGAAWCAPCRALEPLVADLAREYAGVLRAVSVDIGEAPTTAQRFGVMSIPTLVFFRDGKEVRRLQGLQPRAKIVRVIQELLR